MKTRLSLLIAAAVIGMSAGPVMAQSHGQDRDDQGHYDKQDKHDDKHYDRHQDKHHDRYDRHDDHRYSGMHDRGRHEGWYKRGGHVPQEYRGGRYVVNDWHREHLRQPPRGYHWVRSDNGDFLLIAVATGVITDLLLHH
ncbi:MAG: RcnB family protein [Rhodanobacter sp.]